MGGFVGYGEGWNLAFFVAVPPMSPFPSHAQWILLYSLVPISVPVSELYCKFSTKCAIGGQRLFPGASVYF